MRARRLLLVLLLSAAAGLHPAGAGSDDDIRSKQADLSRLRKEIQTYETRIKEREKKENATLDLVDTYDRQATLMRKLIRKLRDQEAALQRSIDSTRQSIGELGDRLSFLKSQYALYVASAYRSGRSRDMLLLLSSSSVNQAVVRAEYLRRFSRQRKSDLGRITSEREAYEDRNLKLRRQLAEQRDLIAEKAKEDKLLLAKLARRRQILASIRRDKKLLKQEVRRSTDAARDLEQLIAKLVERERIRKAREAELARSPGAAARSPVSSNSVFERKRGRLRWPVTRGTIAAHFGNKEHPVLHTVTQNTGIDIALPTGSGVESVAEGEVSTISWLPSFGNLVIVDHSGGYRTVYAHLSEIDVSEGQRVGEGRRIGTTGESLAGPMLHFEIWRDRDKQDPEDWLQPQGLSQR